MTGSDASVHATINVAVGVATCNRPAQLGRVLQSFDDLIAPDGVALTFVVIDNGDADPETEAMVQRFAGRSPWPVQFVREPTRGIPYARNTMLETALASGARFLLGLDDDEVATPDWVAQMLPVLTKGGYPLVGGPIERCAEPGADLSPSETWYLDALREDAALDAIERSALQQERPGFNRVYTNNFGLDLDAVRRSCLRYDPKFTLSGGEDSDFAIRMLEAEGRLGWAPDAVVKELLPKVRLRAGYHINRQKELALMLSDLRGWGRARIFWAVLEEIVDVGLAAAVAPFRGRQAKLLVLYRVGRLKGYWAAAFGSESRHYAPGQEHMR